MELLFARLPKDLQLHAIKQLARFVTTSTLASVTNEASLICNAAAWAAPETCVDLLMKPLLSRVEEEVKHDGTAGSGRMSKASPAGSVFCFSSSSSSSSSFSLLLLLCSSKQAL